MDKIYSKGQWMAETVESLSFNESLRAAYHDVLMRTIGDAADDPFFAKDRYSTADGIGRPEKARVVGQWLCALTRIEPEALAHKKAAALLSSGTLDDLWQHATAWLEELGFSKKLPSLPDDERQMFTFVDGYKMVALTCPEAIRNEANTSGMCGSVKNGCETWVLRNSENQSIAMIGVKGSEVVFMDGPDGGRVPFHISEAYLFAEFAERGLTLAEPNLIHGAVMTSDGIIHDLRDIPEGSTINGDLWIRHEGHLVSRLPDNLTINGDFGIFKSTYFTSTPSNFVVAGTVGVVDCPGFRKVSHGLRVGKWTDLASCKGLSRIDDDVDFGEKVSFAVEATKLVAKPFRAGGLRLLGDGMNIRFDGGAVPRNVDGLVEIDGSYIERARKRQFQKDVAALPGMLARVAFDELSLRIRRSARSLKRSIQSKVATDDHKPPSAKP